MSNQLYNSLNPNLMYGTAWKEDRTRDLTLMAIKAGCRLFDTANQRKHYYEAAVGDALGHAYRTGLVRREDVFLQTKFTYLRGQDNRLPYDPQASLDQQVEQSFASSQEHLGVEVIDSYLLHGPASGIGLAADDRIVWAAMESLQVRGKIRYLGVSNVNLEQLRLFYDNAKIKPTFVQNRCFAVRGWDADIRKFCDEHKMIYQGFSLLTANVDVLRHPLIGKIAHDKRCTIAQLIFRFTQQMRMLPLTGTSSVDHLKSDLACGDVSLSESELTAIENIAHS